MTTERRKDTPPEGIEPTSSAFRGAILLLYRKGVYVLFCVSPSYVRRRTLLTDNREPLLYDDQKIKREQFANWFQTNFRREDTFGILFSDETFFDIDGAHNPENERMWSINRADAR